MQKTVTIKVYHSGHPTEQPGWYEQQITINSWQVRDATNVQLDRVWLPFANKWSGLSLRNKQVRRPDGKYYRSFVEYLHRQSTHRSVHRRDKSKLDYSDTNMKFT